MKNFTFYKQIVIKSFTKGQPANSIPEQTITDFLLKCTFQKLVKQYTSAEYQGVSWS